MKIFAAFLLLLVVQSNAHALASDKKCYKDFRVCIFYLEVATGKIINFDDLPADFVEQQGAGEVEAFEFYCYGRDTGLITEITTRGLASDGKMCGETFAADHIPKPCGYTRWDRNDSSCIEP